MKWTRTSVWDEVLRWGEWDGDGRIRAAVGAVYIWFGAIDEAELEYQCVGTTLAGAGMEFYTAVPMKRNFYEDHCSIFLWSCQFDIWGED